MSTESSTMRLSDFFPHSTIVRDGEFQGLDEAASPHPGSLAFCQQLDYLLLAAANPNVTCIVTKPELAVDAGSKAIVVAADPRLAFFRLYRKLSQDRRLLPEMGSFEIGSGVKIHPSAVVSKLVRIGNNVTIGANAVVEDYSDIGDGSVIGPNAVVGAEGLMSLWDEDGNPVLVPHAGSVAIGENVLVLAGTVIAKSMFMTPTRIGDRCQIGILTNIGHGAQIGQGSVVSGNCIIAGRVTVGSGAWIGASCSIGQGLSVGAKAQVKMGSVVVQNVGDGEIVSGNFAVPHSMNVRAFLKAKTR